MFSTMWAFHLSNESPGLINCYQEVTVITKKIHSDTHQEVTVFLQKINPDILLVVDCDRDGIWPFC